MQQNLSKQIFHLSQKPLAKSVDAIMVWVGIACDINYGNVFIRGFFQLTTGESTRHVPVEQ